jgi:hypothetical protein
MRFIKAIIMALAVAAIMVLGFGSTAQAATDISLGGSCTTTNGVNVATSANFNNTTGSPSRGYLDYVVISATVHLNDVSPANPGYWIAYNTSGTQIDSGTFPRSYTLSGGRYHYRADPNVSGVRQVLINGQSRAGSNCSPSSHIYSQN